MSLSGNMMSEVPDSATLSRAFGELFSGAKETFDDLQKELAGFLPSMPGMPVGKFGDLSVGIDMHQTVTPPSPVMAVPHVEKVYDIMAEIMAGLAAAMPEQTGGIGTVAAAMAKGMAPSVKVYGKWIAQAGVGVLLLPAYVIHPALGEGERHFDREEQLTWTRDAEGSCWRTQTVCCTVSTDLKTDRDTGWSPPCRQGTDLS